MGFLQTCEFSNNPSLNCPAFSATSIHVRPNLTNYRKLAVASASFKQVPIHSRIRKQLDQSVLPVEGLSSDFHGCFKDTRWDGGMGI